MYTGLTRLWKNDSSASQPRSQRSQRVKQHVSLASSQWNMMNGVQMACSTTSCGWPLKGA